MPFTEHSKLARLFQSRSLMVALATLVVLAVAGTTLGYAARTKSVTLSLDGQAKTVSASGDTVGEVLQALATAHPDTREQLFSADGELNRYVNVYLNDEDVRVLDGLETPVGGSDTLVILPAMAGGA